MCDLQSLYLLVDSRTENVVLLQIKPAITSRVNSLFIELVTSFPIENLSIIILKKNKNYLIFHTLNQVCAGVQR